MRQSAFPAARADWGAGIITDPTIRIRTKNKRMNLWDILISFLLQAYRIRAGFAIGSPMLAPTEWVERPPQKHWFNAAREFAAMMYTTMFNILLNQNICLRTFPTIPINLSCLCNIYTTIYTQIQSWHLSHLGYSFCPCVLAGSESICLTTKKRKCHLGGSLLQCRREQWNPPDLHRARTHGCAD